jgi:hypothetical protein
MPYALVPEDYTLKKVTKQQKEAVDKHNSNEAVQAFFDGPASGELVKAVALVVTPIVLAALAKGELGKLLGMTSEGAEKFTSNILESAGIDLSALGTFSP